MVSDSWNSGEPYEAFMGRWSLLLGEKFLEWLSPTESKTWLDAGCGTGALSQSIVTAAKPSKVTAIDLSEGFVETANKRLGNSVHCEVGDASDLSFADSSFNYVVSGLVLNFIPHPEQMLREMMRVTEAGGTVATYVWDYAGKMELLKYFWDSVVECDESAAEMHEARRFSDFGEKTIQHHYKKAGLSNPLIEAIEIKTVFKDFDDYWTPFLGGQGPGPAYLRSLDDGQIKHLSGVVQEKLPIQLDGTIPLVARAWLARSVAC